MDGTFTRMIFSTAALAAVAAVLAGPAGAEQTIPYLSQGVGVDRSQLDGQAAPRLTGVHAALLDRHSPPSAPESLGLNGDSPLGRVSAPTVSGGNDIDWTSFGAGAGMAALVAAALGGILVTVRRRHTVGMP